ncbi:class I SAM-dependent methyltransferase [Enterovirga sp.]|uniref:class I SAM-dependent methyltransferase n=1 Tax=Enterovirga sp. TaxID=2026350 RepID=UPI002B5F293B|nr:class I SAM-dependent methyltransferase [Enterovirga sp.]HMO29024.1 class I SAM-dependent methyltransferase [Enterovirga sp.]
MSPSPDAEAVATAVRDFYERHPYPRPVEELRPDAESEAERLEEYHLLWPSRAFREERSILVAGCGTAQAARHALRWPRARVVGIDVSEASIAHARALKEKHGLANLELRRLPVEEAGRLGETFDQIVCTGVLHHLPDPDAGLRALREALAPQGRMLLMVYAPYGRAGIYLLQEYGRLIGIEATTAGIRDLASALRLLPAGHPLWPLLRNSPDFRYDAGLADALLHPRDRPYSVPQFLAFAARNRLLFSRWRRQAPYLPHCGAPRGTPHYARLAQLGPETQYAAMELYRGTMLRHSAVLCRDDDHSGGRKIDFAGDDWLDAVPLRVVDSVCIEEKLPPGKAGVLLNRSHTDTDIYLPIDAGQKRFVEAIDGRRTARSLAVHLRPQSSIRDFVEQLWRHDQILLRMKEADPVSRAQPG